MAAMSTAQTATTLTPPSSSHGDVNGFQWDFQTTAGKPEVSFFSLSSKPTLSCRGFREHFGEGSATSDILSRLGAWRG